MAFYFTNLTKEPEMTKIVFVLVIVLVALPASEILNPVSVIGISASGGEVFAFEPLFEARIDYWAGDGPRSVFCADLDGDTDLDLAVANYYSDNVSILKNNGDGTYQSAVNYGAGNYPDRKSVV